jgi:hypothetical protein
MTTIYKKLVEAKRKFPVIIKDTKGFGYNYANLAQYLDAISIPLWDAGLDLFQQAKEGIMSTGIVDLDTGDIVILVEFPIMSVTMAKTNELQNFGGGLTYLRRYSIQQAFGLASEDDDGHNSTNVVITKQKQSAAALLAPVALVAPVDKIGIIELFDKVKDNITDEKTLAKAHLMAEEGADDESWAKLHKYLLTL